MVYIVTFMRPSDSSIKETLSRIPEIKQRTFFAFLNVVTVYQAEHSPLHPWERRKFSIQPLAVPVKDFAYVGISEIQISNLLLILKQIYRIIPATQIAISVLTVYNDLPNPLIVKSPNGVKYVTGLDEEIIDRAYRILLEKFGGIELTKVKEIQLLRPEESKIIIRQIPKLKEAEGIGYIKFYAKGPKIPVGKTYTRKYRLIKLLMDPLGTARTIDSVFERIRYPKDELDSELKGVSRIEREKEIIDHTMGELQKIKGLRGRVKLTYLLNHTVSLNLG